MNIPQSPEGEESPIKEVCPFKVGDAISYKPSLRGHGLDAMVSDEGRLVPGRVYKVVQIQAESYIVVEGYRHHGGGIYWTEFELVESHPADDAKGAPE